MKFISALVCSLPAPAQRALGRLLGWIFWLIVPLWRKNLATSQARECLGVEETEARRIAKASVVKFGPMIVEVLCFPLLNKENIDRKVVFKNKEEFAALMREGKGAIIATAHFGNWELLGAALALYGFPLLAVTQKQTQIAMDRFINEYRSMAGEHVIYRTGVLQMARMLDRGYAIGLLSDQDGAPDGVNVDFFGRLSICPKGAVTLARLKGAPLALTLISSLPDGRHEIIMRPPVYIERSADKEKDITEATAALMKNLEEEIRRQPQMWFWLHDRWKVRRALQK